MKCVILCAGYATRLYPLTLDKPKPLLPVKGKPLLDYIFDKLELVDDVDEVFIVTNDKFYSHFLDWSKGLESSKKVKVINDMTKSNDDRLGGLGDLWLAVEGEGIDDDLMVLAGDNLFDSDLNSFVNSFREKGSAIIALQDVGDFEEARKFGVMELDSNGKIVSFEEKPENPKSTLVSTAIYLYSKDELKKIEDYMESDKTKEGPGYLIPYFMESQDVYGHVLEGTWYDIGDRKIYDKVNRED